MSWVYGVVVLFISIVLWVVQAILIGRWAHKAGPGIHSEIV